MIQYINIIRDSPIAVINEKCYKRINNKHIVRYDLIFGISSDNIIQRHYHCEFYYEYEGNINDGNGVYYSYGAAEFWDIYIDGVLERFVCEINDGSERSKLDCFPTLQAFLCSELIEDVEECGINGTNLCEERCKQWRVNPTAEYEEQSQVITLHMDVIIERSNDVLATNTIQFMTDYNEWHTINSYPHGIMVLQNNEYIIYHNGIQM